MQGGPGRVQPAYGWRTPAVRDLGAVEEVLLAGPGRGDVLLWTAWPTTDLRRRGWQLEGHPPLLYRPAGGRLPRLATSRYAASVTRRRSRTGSASRRGLPFDDLMPWRPGVLFDSRVLAGPLRLWVGYADRRPVGAAASYLAYGLHVLALGVALPQARRRGYWQALRARLADRKGRRRRACSAT